MKYKEIAHGDRISIVPEQTFASEAEALPGSTDIVLIWVCDCPMKENCVRIDYNVTSFCKHMGAYPDKLKGIPIVESLRCKHPNSPSDDLKVSLLKTFYCSLEKACIDARGLCGDLKDVTPPPGYDWSRPHFSVVCSHIAQRSSGS